MARIKFDYSVGLLVRSAVKGEIMRVAHHFDMTVKFEDDGGFFYSQVFVTMEGDSDEKAKAAFDVIQRFFQANANDSV